MIQQWSPSRLKTYYECARKAQYKFVMKLKDGGNKYSERGTDIHTQLHKVLTEDASMEGLDLKGLPSVKRLFEMVDGRPYVAEQQIAHRQDWTLTQWFEKDVYMRIMMDLAVLDPPEKEVLVVDYKTGKIYEEDHKNQMEIYAVSAFHQFPFADEVVTGLLYLDQDKLVIDSYTREVLPELQAKIDKKCADGMADTEFLAQPGRHCYNCPFNLSKGGPCIHG